MAAKQFGPIEGIEVGATFANRTELRLSGLHAPPQGGISGSPSDGADSIVVSGGYADDDDQGDVIYYTGQGGNDPATKKQIADQDLVRGNAGLARSRDEGLPVRVIRGAGGDPAWSPSSGFRYDGIFRVTDYWPVVGVDGFRIWRFKLEKEPSVLVPLGGPEAIPTSKQATIQRIVRNTAISQRVKDLHKHQCQVCGTAVETLAGPYGEGAHVRGLGRPHNGPDSMQNLLCLCPNHHVMFDGLAIYIDEAMDVRATRTGAPLGTLRTHPSHHLSPEHVAYHRALCEKAAE